MVGILIKQGYLSRGEDGKRLPLGPQWTRKKLELTPVV